MLLYYIKESLNTFRRTKVFSFFSVLSLSLSISLIACVGFLYIASGKIEDKLKNKIEVLIFLDDDINEKNKNTITQKINSYDFVNRYEYISKESAIDEFIEKSGQNIKSILENNPLPAYISVNFKGILSEDDIATLKMNIVNLEGVTDVVLDYDTIINVLNYLNNMKIVLGIITIFITFISIYLIFASSKFYILHNTNCYNTMKLVGAKLNTIRIPLLLRGIIIGVLSSILSIIIINVIIITLETFSQQIKFVPSLYFINFVLVLLGLMLGPVGTGIFSKKVSLTIATNR
jgi:cell division transport system permease protein